MSSPKHYTANSQEWNRHKTNAIMSERTLREVYLPAFEMIVKEAHPATIMAAYNNINGVHNSENPLLLQQIFRGEWGWIDFFLTDWACHHKADSSANAGLNLKMSVKQVEDNG
ncbi:glycoside hydrolase family 3 N-terminal domain-containing protein [Lentisphaera marina]|uniref:glycoside hydrolase family 3 N-terminal domain-containing protein n=1 Tax=Lentisphaera marina TaxID=1111041 RepID=UPI002366A5C1|nr:glycoside hydrolase family 3 N-terminal domain-containing protein [Lentisphaera marina]MDD7987251.1 glycoside hydrolase family 3 N-terminal domain-containing protein [Lentisphaera marina]